MGEGGTHYKITQNEAFQAVSIDYAVEVKKGEKRKTAG